MTPRATDQAIDHMVAAQTALIAAIDARDANAIEQATAALNQAIIQMRAQDVWHDGNDLRDRIGHALRQNDAARIRINTMTEWTRQRIDGIARLRGAEPVHTYGNLCNSAKKLATR
jgi:hypothetical protein